MVLTALRCRSELSDQQESSVSLNAFAGCYNRGKLDVSCSECERTQCRMRLSAQRALRRYSCYCTVCSVFCADGYNVLNWIMQQSDLTQ